MHTTIIAEAGVNHNGSMTLAKQMVEKAKQAGADYVKFQTFVPEKLVSRFAQKAEYQKETTGAAESQLQMLQKLALTQEDFIELQAYCKTIGIGFLSTPFDLDSIAFLEKLDMDFWKLPSGEITNLPYLEAIGRTGRDIVMSTGMCNMQEIQDAISILEKSGAGKIIVLHCNTEYPTPYTDVNLLAMQQMRQTLQKPVGYSDHTIGIEAPKCVTDQDYILKRTKLPRISDGICTRNDKAVEIRLVKSGKVEGCNIWRQWNKRIGCSQFIVDL